MTVVSISHLRACLLFLVVVPDPWGRGVRKVGRAALYRVKPLVSALTR